MSDSTISGDNVNKDQSQHEPRQQQSNHNQRQQGKQNSNNGFDGDSIPDQSADSFKTSEEQFKDLHNRLQGTNHQLVTVYNAVSKHHQMDEARHDELKREFSSLRSELAALRQIGDLQAKIKALETEIQSMHHDMRQKLAAHGESFDTQLRHHHLSLASALTASIPGHGKLMFLFIGTQIVLVVAYAVYKRRKASSPKKYL
jgi:mannose-binding lectin 1